MDRPVQKAQRRRASLSKFKSSFPKLLIESVMISFGVLLAFAADNWKTERQMHNNTQLVLSNLKNELTRNRSIVLEYLGYHDSLQVKIDSLLELEQQALGQDMKVLSVLKSLYPEPSVSFLLQETAWQTAHSHQVIRNFKYLTSYNLTNCYKYHEHILRSRNAVFNLTHGSHGQSAISYWVVLKQLYEELSAQESYLLQVYRDALIEVDKELVGRGT